MDQTGMSQPRVSQTIVNGTLGTPAVFSVLLLLCAMLIGWSIAKMSQVHDELMRTNRELRLLQVDTQDLSAILLKKGYVSPSDIRKPVSPDDEEKPDERNRLQNHN